MSYVKLAAQAREIARILDQMALTPVKPGYTSAQVRAFANRGQILLMRAGAVVADYGDTRVSSADYGTGIAAALAAAASGDTILMRGVYATGDSFELDTDGVTILCDDVTIAPSGDYPYLFSIASDDCHVNGLTVDGLSTANTDVGLGIKVTGDRNRLVNCASNHIRGNPVSNGNGSAAYIGGNDNLIERFTSYDAMYAAIRSHDANRVTYRAIKVVDPQSRAFNFEGEEDVELVTIDGLDGVCNVGDGTGGCGININPTGSIKTVKFDHIQLHNGDIVSAGVSYDHASTLQMLKIQNVEEFYMNNSSLTHGTNANGDSTTLAYQAGSFTMPRTFLTDCVFSDGMTWGAQYLDYVRWTRCHFGKHANETGILSWTLHCKDFLAQDCVFNGHGGTRLFTASGSRAATDRFAIINSRMLADKATDFFVIDSGINVSAGNHRFSGNELINAGAGEFYRCHGADNEMGELSLTTDHNGDMQFDDTNIGTGPGQHPDPGSGPSYFSGMAVPDTNGRKIWNINWSPNDTQTIPERGWISHGGAWKEIT